MKKAAPAPAPEEEDAQVESASIAPAPEPAPAPAKEATIVGTSANYDSVTILFSGPGSDEVENFNLLCLPSDEANFGVFDNNAKGECVCVSVWGAIDVVGLVFVTRLRIKIGHMHDSNHNILTQSPLHPAPPQALSRSRATPPRRRSRTCPRATTAAP